jgi:hypothetical protein
MKRYLRVSVCLLSLFSLSLSTPLNVSRAKAPRPDCIRVNLHNTSVFDHTYTIMVKVKCSCINNMTWTTAVSKGQSVSIGVCSSHTVENPEGYGEFYYHTDGQPPNAPWNHATLMHDGDTYTM